MVRLCKWLLMLATLLGGVRPLAAASTAESGDFATYTTIFNAGLWPSAAEEMATFVKRYPKSPLVPAAVLYEARARFYLNQFGATLNLLSANQSRTNPLADQYLYWTGRAHFENTNYPAAADAFARLTGTFTNSPLRLDATIREAASRARLGDWPGTVSLLQATNGVFQQTLRSGTSGETIVRGLLLLGEAQLAQTNFNGVAEALQSLSELTRNADLKWSRLFLQARWERAQGHLADALDTATNLVVSDNSTNRAEGNVFTGETYEQLGEFELAANQYGLNVSNAPVQYRRHALLKIGELSLTRTNFAGAMDTLQRFLTQFPADSAADAALLALGELELAQHLSGGGTNRTESATNNFCERALGHFETLLRDFPNSPLAGKALLNKGWCLWSEGNYAASEAAFAQAVERLPFSEDQAIARFKWADAQFMRTNFYGALNNYHFLTTYYAAVPGVKENLLEQALYQTVRASLNVNDLDSATNALQKILDWYPDGFAGDRCLLYVGQGFAQGGDTARARRLFSDVQVRRPATSLVPQARLAVARTYEREGNWDAAITNYDEWILTYTNHTELPRAKFSRAWDYYMAGQETNALTQFTDFVAHYHDHELAPRAQYWIGDYYLRNDNHLEAQKNYQLVRNTNLPPTRLTYQAQIMAGRACERSGGYDQAIQFYFQDLFNNTNCPPDLRAQALFDWGDALVTRGSTNKPADFPSAIAVFRLIPTNSDLFVPAKGRIGECYFNLGGPTNLQSAANEFQQILGMTNASLNARYQAKIELGMIAEALATLEGGDADATLRSQELRSQALRYYLEVLFDESNPGEDRQSEIFSIQKAGLQAGLLAEKLNQRSQAVTIYRKLQDLLPVLRLEEKISKAQRNQ
jgi:TolA-binding protein